MRRTHMALGLGAVTVLAVVVGVVALSASGGPSTSHLPGHSVSWQLDRGYGGPAFDPSTAMTTTVVPIEVSHPACIPSSGASWFDVSVSYTSVSVTIQVRMTDDAAALCPTGVEPQPGGSLPLVGDYLSGVYYPVQLREPLGGRALFDGFTVPAQARPY